MGDKEIAWFKEISKADIPLVGGKGANLGEMYNSRFPIPPGFCVTANAYKRFLKESGIGEKIYPVLDRLDVNETEKLQEVAEQVQNVILNAKMPEEVRGKIIEAYNNLTIDIDVYKLAGKEALSMVKAGRDLPFVAVRSSATAEDLPTASFAGQQKTYLNVKGSDNVAIAVQKCWASLFTARAIYYRIKNNFDHKKVFIAVIVQKMVNSTRAGVAFSINPSTNNENEIVIEAGWGLGDAVVAGQVTPDSYVIDKKSFEIKDVKINDQEFEYIRDDNLGRTVKKSVPPGKRNTQILSVNEVKRLSKFVLDIESHYGKPQDIEWAVEDGRLFIVQTRPVTTLKKIEKQKTITREETVKEEIPREVILSGLSASPGIGSGSVKLVHDLTDLSKIQKGNVLVARMTNPDYVAAMERASAIVTDEGGTTCMSGNTKILTNKGFMSIETAHNLIKENNKLMILSYNYKNKKPTWKKIINGFRRKSKAIRISTSQKGCMNHNTIDITPDHKIYTYKNRRLIKKGVEQVLNDKEYLCLIDSLPKIDSEKNIQKLAYLMGAIISDGHIKIDYHNSGNPRRGSITLTQKEVEEKINFIQEVNNCLVEIFGKCFTISRFKEHSGIIRNGLLQGTASDFTSFNLQGALYLNKIYQNLDLWTLSLNEESSLAFLAGLIDGDGSFYNNRLHIYNSDEKTLQGITLTCLKLNIFPQVTKNRDINNIQILERIQDILKFTKRVKGIVKYKQLGTKLFSAKQILVDVIDKINWKGKIKPYVNKNLLIDSRKVIERILPMADKNLQNELIEVLKSNLRMHRVTKVCDISEIDVFNLEVDANEELEKNYIVFTTKYTPLLVSNCHAAIVSREMGIPCVVGTEKATQVLRDGQEITVDGGAGKVYGGKIEIKEEATEQEVIESGEIDTITEIKVIMDLPKYAERAAQTGADGVGLLRCEFMILGEKEHPIYLIQQNRKQELVEDLAKNISIIANAFRGKPVWYRTLDAPTDEFRRLKGGEGEPEEDNPMMGWRSIRRELDQPELLKAEFEAIKKVHDQGLTNVGVMLPLVTDVGQVKKAKEYLKEIGLEPQENIDFGVMVETPASVQIIKELCEEGLDFVSFGTNDLTQFTLAVDRNNAKVQKLYDEMHPAVLRQIKYVIKVCREYNVETSICGQAGSDPEMAEFLVKAGIDSITANPDAVAKIRRTVSRAEKKLLLSVARSKMDKNG